MSSTDLTDPAKFKLQADGSLKRPQSAFRDWIVPGSGKFEPEKGRYHLYVSLACPWAHRTLIVRKLKGLEEIIPIHVVSPHLGEHGWPFASADPYPGADVDPLFDAKHMKDLYLRVDPQYQARCSVPMLWDTKLSTIVNNESSEIIRMLYTAFDALLPESVASLDLYPEAHRKEIDDMNEWVYDTVNNGVYKAGFAGTQKAYEDAVLPLFASLDKLEQTLEGKDYLVGDRLTEADIRLYPTIIRFDVVYATHFKCNIRTIRSGYPNLHRWLRKLYWTVPAFGETTNFDHIKVHYFWSHPMINPHRIVPVGPLPHILSL
ncbi:glutathione S-transferase [Punctularia strigosozonata HHB-11173 SS5]|uniref:glutathione S-transferase n=1 Tax=Punctularia strigosozonata (strain HHB-11173) TaxID=741275 RepID=UPI0004417E2D|nr:glutathione S-transferase [Punctularia strigosozonata HHB-11173 SS5]EIN11188.1 glutathione S-transferase [Punctularia strigosozonata HHB-11173 SS5]